MRPRSQVVKTSEVFKTSEVCLRLTLLGGVSTLRVRCGHRLVAASEDALLRRLESFDLSAGACEILGDRDLRSCQNFGSLSRKLDTPMSGVALTRADSPGIVASTRSLAFVKSRVGARGR